MKTESCMMKRSLLWRSIAVLIDLMFLAGPPVLLAKTKPPKQDPQQARAEYIARVQQQSDAILPLATLGSLYVPNGVLSDVNADYKAHTVGDVVTLQVIEQTTAQSTGDVNSQRTFQTSSAITALPGKLKTGGVNPLFGANSSTALFVSDSGFMVTLPCSYNFVPFVATLEPTFSMNFSSFGVK